MFTGERITRRLREAYLAALLRQEISFFGTMGVGECTAGLTTDINIIQKGISEKVARTIHALSTFCAAFIVGFVLCWQLTLTLTWSVGLVMALMATGIHYNRIFTRNLAQESSSAIAVAAEAVSSIRIIKALGAEDRLASKYRQYLNGALRWGTRQKVSLGITLGEFFLFEVKTRRCQWQSFRAKDTKVCLGSDPRRTPCLNFVLTSSNHFRPRLHC